MKTILITFLLLAVVLSKTLEYKLQNKQVFAEAAATTTTTPTTPQTTTNPPADPKPKEKDPKVPKEKSKFEQCVAKKCADQAKLCDESCVRTLTNCQPIAYRVGKAAYNSCVDANAKSKAIIECAWKDCKSVEGQ